MGLDLEQYRADADRFSESLAREYYLHLAGHKPELEIEPIYERHGELLSRESVAGLREAMDSASGDEARRLGYLLEFAVGGHLGLATAGAEARVAGLEAELELELDGGAIGFREAPVIQANEADAGRRAAISGARDELLTEHLNPLHVEMLESSHALARELGWPSYRDMCAELSGVDLEALARQTREFLGATETAYPEIIGPQLERAELAPLGELRRSDLPRFFRAQRLDSMFPAERMVSSFEATLIGLGMDPAAQPNIHLDTEARATKSPRAFCSAARIPEEVYLVIAPIGGRDDYATLFHEGGHAEHYGNVDPGLALEYRRFGDNSVTESFAFLLMGLAAEPEWLSARLGIEDASEVCDHDRAERLVYLRRYAAKLDYELELHGEDADLAAMPERYSRSQSDAAGVEWPRATWAADVDPGFYVACYLRAWALEAIWRQALRERFGERWFASPEAGAWLRGLWSSGQRLRADELLAETLGEQLDFTALAAAFAPGE